MLSAKAYLLPTDLLAHRGTAYLIPSAEHIRLPRCLYQGAQLRCIYNLRWSAMRNRNTAVPVPSFRRLHDVV